jgi:carbon dioxide concentrating mechanism protein CcmN
MQPLHPALGQALLSGNVTVHPGAVVACGVILRTDAHSQLIVEAGVCIGMGSVIHARNGNLILEAGASLGAGSLIFGHGKIGANACIGSLTTILNPEIAPEQIIPPGILIGDTSRRIDDMGSSHQRIQAPAVQPQLAESNGAPSLELSAPQVEQERPAIVGQAYVNRLRMSLFPHTAQLEAPIDES